MSASAHPAITLARRFASAVAAVSIAVGVIGCRTVKKPTKAEEAAAMTAWAEWWVANRDAIQEHEDAMYARRFFRRNP